MSIKAWAIRLRDGKYVLRHDGLPRLFSDQDEARLIVRRWRTSSFWVRSGARVEEIAFPPPTADVHDGDSQIREAILAVLDDPPRLTYCGFKTRRTDEMQDILDSFIQRIRDALDEYCSRSTAARYHHQGDRP